ncbi:MAG: NAD-dependent epimerase/dehydratase family protein [Oscillospiraceae bacterium]|nr:NAD-dependent epimerase/dehydratase family protein [Oscillospiraceae bacterium]
MNILITGASGFIGKNLKANLCSRGEDNLLCFDLPQTEEDLQELVRRADLVFHLAGVNRPENESEFQTGNTALTESLVEMLERENRCIPVVLPSSVQAELDNPYGRSKKAAEDIVFEYGCRTGAPVYVYRLSGVFGKWCRPDYNSVVATFCHNAARGIALRIDNTETMLTLLYIDDLLSEFNKILEGKVTSQEGSLLKISQTYKITLGELAEKINSFAKSRSSFTLQHDMNEPLNRKLYATFISYADPYDLAVLADMKTDGRGHFSELIRSPHFGQISVSTTKPGITRGNHWHDTKVEKFVVVQGEALIRLRKIGSSEIIRYSVSGGEIQVVDIPPGYTHSIQNTGEIDVITIFWAGEIFDPGNPDTIFEAVEV